MESDEATGVASGWPPPHTSPPGPPPREYGSPGGPPDRTWVWVSVGVVCALVLFVGGGFWLLAGADDATGGEDAKAEAASATGAPSATARESAGASASESAAEPAASPSAPEPERTQCWDGSVADGVAGCSAPDGAAGLAWLFPQVTGQQCKPPKQGLAGTVVRVLCTATVQDTTVSIGYFQWESVAAGQAYYDQQGLSRNDVHGFLGWAATIGNRTKKAVMYADAPYSRTLVFRTRVKDSAELQRLQPRPPGRINGEPLG